MPHRISVKALIAKDMVLVARWLIYILLDIPGPIIPEARWPILMCGTWHDGP